MRIGATFIIVTIAVFFTAFALLAFLGGFGAILINHSAGDVTDGWNLVLLGTILIILALTLFVASWKISPKDKA